MKHSWTDAEQAKLVSLRAAGLTWKAIAAEMGMTIWQVSGMWRHIVKVRQGKPKRPITFVKQSAGRRQKPQEPAWDFSGENIR